MIDDGTIGISYPHPCYLYDSRLINEEVFRKLSTQRVLTPEYVQHMIWPDLLSVQGFANTQLREKMSIGLFRINDAYWSGLKDQLIARYEGKFVFHATVLQLGDPHYLIWPLGSESIYVIPCKRARLFWYRKFNGPVEIELGRNKKWFQAYDHPFTEHFYFSRTYKVNYLLGIFEKRPLSVEAINDVVRYKGCYDDAGEKCVLDEKALYPPFWLVKHKDDIKPLDAPEYACSGILTD